jgi:hypothetical protein
MGNIMFSMPAFVLAAIRGLLDTKEPRETGRIRRTRTWRLGHRGIITVRKRNRRSGSRGQSTGEQSFNNANSDVRGDAFAAVGVGQDTLGEGHWGRDRAGGQKTGRGGTGKKDAGGQETRRNDTGREYDFNSGVISNMFFQNGHHSH